MEFIFNNKIDVGDKKIKRFNLQHITPMKDINNSNNAIKDFMESEKGKELISKYNGFPLIKFNGSEYNLYNEKNILEKYFYNISNLIGITKFINNDYGIIHLYNGFKLHKYSTLRTMMCKPDGFDSKCKSLIFYIDENEDIDDLKR